MSSAYHGILRRMSLWGALGGLVSGALVASLSDRIFFPYAGVLFALVVGVPVWLWGRHFLPRPTPPLRGIVAFLLVGVVAPFCGLASVIAVDWAMSPKPSTLLILATSLLPTALWATCVAASIKLVSGSWDWQFVWQMIIGGSCVWALTTQGNQLGVSPAVLFLTGGLLVTGFLLGASLDRQISVPCSEVHAAHGST
jgi:hypothetical protein